MAVKQHGRLPEELAVRFEGLSPTDRIEAVLATKAPEDQRFLSAFMEEQCKLKEVKVLSPNATLITFAFKVARWYCNGSGTYTDVYAPIHPSQTCTDPYILDYQGNLHGGAQSGIYDFCTSVALQSIGKRDFWINGGVSRTLNVTYLRPAPEGEDLLLDCEIVHTGKKLALLRGVIKRESDGAVISTCDHDKAAVPTKPGWKL